jgi:hypothetical protein
MRHKAIDKVTAAHIAVDLLTKDMDPVKELEHEERAMELMEDAVYEFSKYLKYKLKRYELFLSEREFTQRSSIEQGNKLISAARALAKERGLE